MLTPYFELNQSQDKLFIVIHAPYSNISDAEIYVDKDELRFYASPYFLRLNLPGHVEDSDEPRVKYNSDNGQFSIELIKCHHGEEFPDLDLIAKLLAPKKSKKLIVKPDIQVLNSTADGKKSSEVSDNDDSESEDSSDEWLLEQQAPEKNTICDSSKAKYGFANKITNVSNILKDEFKDVFDVRNIEETSESKIKRENEENEKFSDDHYLFDLMDCSVELEQALCLKSTNYKDEKFDSDELNLLKDFGNREYILNKEERKIAYLSLVDILCGFAYDYRTTLGESTVESAWTINKLSATLAWLESFASVKDVVICFVRRSLCYPLYRNWELSMKVLDDVNEILRSGVKRVIRCLLAIYRMFNESDPRYVLNQLYIVDYIIWLQNQHNVANKLTQMAKQIIEVKTSLQKTDVDFDIDVLEVAAKSALEDDLSLNMNKVNIQDSEDSSSDDEELDSDDDVSAD